MPGGSGALRLAVVGRGEGFHHPGSSHTRARWRLERWSSTTGARIRHELSLQGAVRADERNGDDAIVESR